MPSNAWIRRQGDEAEVGCSQSDRTWEITCVDGVWQGDMGDCASAATGGKCAHQYVRNFNVILIQ